MNNPSRHSQAPVPAPIGSGLLWRGGLVLGLLWLLAVGCLEISAQQGLNDTNRRGVVASVDMPLHANSEHSFSLKRFFSRANNQTNPLNFPEPLWLLLASEFRTVPAPEFFNQALLAVIAPRICWRQLQSLNVPRAPPLV